MPRLLRLVLLAVAVTVLAVACSGDDDDGQAAPTIEPDEAVADATATPAATATATAEPTASPVPSPTPESLPFRVPAVALLDGGDGPQPPLPNPPVDEGWTLEEYSIAGTATSYVDDGPTDDDGFWDASEGEPADFKTRLLVRRPPADRFSGVVLVEWLNVTSGADTAPDYGFLSEEILRRGHAYVGVSAQSVAVDGSDREFLGAGLIDTRGLVVRDPERYGDLVHPGDAWAYDIFTQAGAAAAGLGDLGILGDLEPQHVIALGESQSAAFMTGYVNAVHPLVGLYDGFLIHSRGAGAPNAAAERLDFIDGGVRVRTDLDAPVFIFEAETDVSLLNYQAARQDDTDLIRVWEVAGTAHADAYTLAASGGVPRDPSLGAFIGCGLINDGPHHETLQAALFHLVAWVVDGTAPPTSPRLELDEDGQIARDERGIGLGGIRTPPVDVPLRILSGDPSSDEGACFLFGLTIDVEPETIAEWYSGLDDFVSRLEDAAAAAVEAGWLLPEDAEVMIAEETERARSLGLG